MATAAGEANAGLASAVAAPAPPPKIEGLPKPGLLSAAPNSEAVEVVVGVPKIDPVVVADGAENKPPPADGVEDAGLPKIEPAAAGVPNKLGAEAVVAAAEGDPNIDTAVVAGAPKIDVDGVVLLLVVPNIEAVVVVAGIPNTDAAVVAAVTVGVPKIEGVLLGVPGTPPPKIEAAGLAGVTADVPPKTEGTLDVDDNDRDPKSDGAAVPDTAPKRGVETVVVAAGAAVVVAVATDSVVTSVFGKTAPIEPKRPPAVVAAATDVASESAFVVAAGEVGLAAVACASVFLAGSAVVAAKPVVGAPNNDGEEVTVSDGGAPKTIAGLVAVVLGAPNSEELVTGVANREALVVMVPKLMAALETVAVPNTPPVAVVFGAPNTDGALDATVVGSPNDESVLFVVTAVPKRSGAFVVTFASPPLTPAEVASATGFVPKIEAVLETAPKSEGAPGVTVLPKIGAVLVLGLPNMDVGVVPNFKGTADAAPNSGCVVALPKSPVDIVVATVAAGLVSAVGAEVGTEDAAGFAAEVADLVRSTTLVLTGVTWVRLTDCGVAPNKDDELEIPKNGVVEVAIEVVTDEGAGFVVAPNMGAVVVEVVAANPKRPAFVDAGVPKKDGVLEAVVG